MLDLSSWTLFFYGSKSNDCVGTGCVLIDPKGIKMMISYWLEFECTNNIANNKALVQGLCYGEKFLWLGVPQ